MTNQQRGIFGIDLGTTYSVVGYIDEAGRAAVTRNNYGLETTPSVVYFESDSNVVVGQAAKEAAGQDPDHVVSLIKREMGEKDYHLDFYGVDYTPPSISALILGALAKEAGEITGRQVVDTVITVPAYFGLLEKDATRKAGEIAGLNVIGIVPEPVAAALQYGISGSADGRTVLVYDLGGGTFDVSIIKITDERIEVLVVGGNHRLGGADWDARLLDAIVDASVAQLGDEGLRDDEAMLQDLRLRAEKMKQDLSAVETKTIQVRFTGTPAKVTITREQFEEMTKDLLDETLRITERTLEDAEGKYPGIRQQISDVLLVGGSTYMPAVTSALQERFGWEAKLNDPNLAVAKGAALYAVGQTVKYWEAEEQAPATESDNVDPPTVTGENVAAVAALAGVDEERLAELASKTVVNVLPKAIGIKLVDTKTPGWENDHESASFVHHLVDKNTQLPVKDVYFEAATMQDGQDVINIELWEQGGEEPTRELSGNVAVDNGSCQIKDVGQHNLPRGSTIQIRLNVSAEGTVTLQAVEPLSGKEVTIVVRISVLSAEQVENAKNVQAGLTVST